MQTALKDKYLSWARELYAEGLCRGHVAEALGISPVTVRTWYRQDQAAGRSWDEARRERERCDPRTVLRKLRKRFADLVDRAEAEGQATNAAEGEGAAKPSDTEERLLKLARIIELCRQTQTDTALTLTALEGLVRFCLRTLSPTQIRPIRDAVEGYMLELKRKSV